MKPHIFFAVAAIAVLDLAIPVKAQIKLTSPTPGADANFGFSVLVHQGIVYVGAPTAAAGGTQRGEVIAFDAATGAFRGRVRSFFNIDYARFGESLAIVGNRLFIGSPALPGPTYGRVYYSTLPIVGERSSTLFVSAPDPGSNENFGAAVAGFGGRLLVGAPDGPAGQGVGKFFEFDTQQNPPALIGGANTAGSVAGARLGASLAGSDQLAVIGSPLHPFTGTQSGRLLLGGNAVFGPYVPPGLPAFSELGDSVAAFGTQVLAGAPNFQPDPSQNNLGTVYLIDGVNARVIRQFTPREAGGRFGESVALNGQFAAVGASYANTRVLETGAFYLIPTRIKPKDEPFFFPIAPGDLGERDRFGAVTSMDANFVAVSAPEQNASGIDDSGAVYIYRLSAPRPVVKPKPKRVTATGTRVKVGGSARGGIVGIARVEYAVRRAGPFEPLRGTTRWRGKARLEAGTRKIFVRAFDAAGNASKLTVIRVNSISNP